MGALLTTRQQEGVEEVDIGANHVYKYPPRSEFVFDCDVQCAITIYYFCTEEITPTGVTYVPRDPSLTSETFHYDRGANQLFCKVSHIFNPSKYTDDDLLYDVDREVIPIAIHCVADEGPEEMRQSHATIATVEKITDGTYLLKALKQKLFVDGLCYLLQEIYGIENKSNDKTDDDETEDNGSECVICMCDVRDTLILPCRHLCLCNSCADSLRYQANNCPICRAPFRALLQIRALQKGASQNLAAISPAEGVCDNIPPGYEAVSLIEALNGPCMPRQPPSAMPDLVETPENENAIQAAQMLNRQCERASSSKSRSGESSGNEYQVTVLMTTRREDETPKCPLLSEQSKSSRKTRSRDSVVLVNEKMDKEEVADEDSEAEKLSPLLQKSNMLGKGKTISRPLNMADVVDPIDDADTDQEEPPSTPAPERSKNYSERGDESDYYTPDEPAPAAGPLYEGPGPSSLESTPQRLPGTPHSHASVRSSADSYTSGSSTRHLLAVVNVKPGGTVGYADKTTNV
ncbi:hypothetical protein NQ318_015150 [Aromia moschata]|uniref:RING-type E3 ubiquitin transferase n=1 Tax=Aromia moschata TaxID=1265417 RepID=A0AAV8X7R5_9CUCU|nr:hypothetical protein NQ318_015150 [Aromia moschata]